MTELQIHQWLVILMLALAAQSFVLLFLVTAPYGRFARPGWGPTLSARSAWILLESPAVVVFAGIYVCGDNAMSMVPLLLFGLWQFHYVLRALVFPFRMRETGKRIPLLIVALAIVLNVLNSYLNARWVSHLGDYPLAWLTSYPFIIGASLFIVGWLINQHADRTLFRLRRPGSPTTRSHGTRFFPTFYRFSRARRFRGRDARLRPACH